MDCDSITPAARIFNKNKYYKYLSPITNKSQNYFALVCAPTTPPALLRSPSHSLSSIYTNCHKTNTFVHSPFYILFLFDTPLAHYCVPPHLNVQKWVARDSSTEEKEKTKRKTKIERPKLSMLHSSLSHF